MAEVITGMDTRVFIGPPIASSVDTLAEFLALDIGNAFVEVELIESLAPYGDSSGEVNFSSLKDGRVRKAKGSRNAGNPEMVVGYDYSDPGQAALRAAQKTNLKYAIKVMLPNPLSPGGDGQIDYFRALVMTDPKNVGNADNVVRQTFQFGIDSEVFTVAPTHAGS